MTRLYIRAVALISLFVSRVSHRTIIGQKGYDASISKLQIYLRKGIHCSNTGVPRSRGMWDWLAHSLDPDLLFLLSDRLDD